MRTNQSTIILQLFQQGFFFFFAAPGQFVDGDAVQRRFHYKSSQREGDVNEGFSFHEKIIDTQSRQLSVAVSQRVEKIYWVSGSFSALRREPLYKCRKWFTDVKWGTKQIGRSCQSDWDGGHLPNCPQRIRPPSFFRVPHLELHMFLWVRQSVTEQLCGHN